MKINFHSKELTIQDEKLGCTITFSESYSADDQFKTVEEIMNSDEKYLLIQMIYAEDEYDVENFHIESSETNADFDPTEKIIFKLNQDRLDLSWSGEKLIIGLNLKKQELNSLLRILETRFHKRITIKK